MAGSSKSGTRVPVSDKHTGIRTISPCERQGIVHAGALQTRTRSSVECRVSMDFSPLRHRDYRLLFVAQSVSLLGTMVSYVALPFQMYRLTHSSLSVGLLGLAELVPLLLTAF